MLSDAPSATTPRRSSLLVPLRPKTSSALDDTTAPLRGHAPDMKRTASQTFTHMEPHGEALSRLQEGHSASYAYPSAMLPQRSPANSISRAGQSLKGSYKHIKRRLSTSSRAAAPSSSFEPPAHHQESPLHRLKVPHQDSGFIPTQQQYHHQGPSGEFARYNPGPAPVPSHWPASLLQTVAQSPIAQAPPSPAPGSAARAAAAAANNERQLSQMRRQEPQTDDYLDMDDNWLLVDRPSSDVLKDSESGVGMSCSSPVEEMEEDHLEKKIDPVDYLPTEITELIFSHLEAPSLVRAERVSKAWQHAAASSHVWKNVFLNRFEPQVHVSPKPISMGGAGCGKFKYGKPVPGQNWKDMYHVRMTINRRWRGCSPNAIYLNGHTDSVYCCQFDENKIITGSRDRTIRVWDMETYTCVKVIGGPTKQPAPETPAPLDVHRETVVNHPSLNGTDKGNAMYHVPREYHDASILCLQYDDKIMVTGSSDHTCLVWDISDPNHNFEPITRLEGHSQGVLDVALDARYVVSCSKDATINVWDRKTFQHIRMLTGHRGPVNAVQLRGNFLVSASGDGVAKLWNLESGACIKEFPSEDRGLAAVEFSDDARYVLAGGNDHVVYKFDALNGQLLHTSAKHGGLVRSLFLDAQNGRVVSGSYDQSIRISDFNTGEVFGVYENWTTSWILSAKGDYRRVVATSQDGRALVLDFGWGVQGAEALGGRVCE